jgi:peptide deformylase
MKDSEALINPEILETSGTCVMEEGCLSIPGFFAPVERPQEIFVQYRLPDGEYADAEFKGRDARVIQHEIDHLCGTLFLDKILPDDRKMALRAFGIEPQE